MDFKLIDLIGIVFLSFSIVFSLTKLLFIDVKTVKAKIVGLTIFICLVSWYNRNRDVAVIRVYINYFSIILCSFILCKTVFKSVITALFELIILTVADMTVGIIFVSILKINAEVGRSNLDYLFISNIVVSTIMILTTSFKPLMKIIKNIIKGINTKKDLAGIITFCFMTAVGILLIYFYFIWIEQTTMKTLLNILLIIIYIITSCSFFYQTVKNIQHKNNLMEINERYNRLEIYSQFNESLVEQLRKQKHEFKNNLVTIRAMADSEHLVNYINSLIKDNTEMDITYISKFKSIDDDGLKGLLAYKVLKMKEKNINVSIHIENSIEKFNLNKLKSDDSKDLYNIMGIIIDNAVEAAEITEDKLIVIQAYAEKNKANFVISNTFNGSVDFNKIFTHGYSTKGSKRGYGLAILHDTVKRNKRIDLNTEIEDNIFSQHIVIKIT